MSTNHSISIPIRDDQEPLVDLGNFDFVLEPRYFLQGLTEERTILLRQGAAEKLAAVQESLGNYKLKIWDGYRPRLIQDKLYHKYFYQLQNQHPEWSQEQLAAKTTIYIASTADPAITPPHATGGAVDLTLIDASGTELDMGTDFDFFGPAARSRYFDDYPIDRTIRNNHKLLREAMEAVGFHEYQEEWWHFDYGNQLWAFDLNKPYAIYGEVGPLMGTIKDQLS